MSVLVVIPDAVVLVNVQLENKEDNANIQTSETSDPMSVFRKLCSSLGFMYSVPPHIRPPSGSETNGLLEGLYHTHTNHSYIFWIHTHLSNEWTHIGKSPRQLWSF